MIVFNKQGGISRCSMLILAVILTGWPGLQTALASGAAQGLSKMEIELTPKYNPGNNEMKNFVIELKDLGLADVDEVATKKVGEPLAYKSIEAITGGVRITWEGKGNVTMENDEKQKTAVVLAKKVDPKKVITVTDAYWKTVNGTRFPSAPNHATLPGFTGRGDPLFTFTNGLTDDTVELRDLQLLGNVPEESIEDLDPNSLPGASPLLSSLSLSPLSETQDFDAGPVDIGNFFYVQGQIFDIDLDRVIGAFVSGYGFPVPEPAGLVMATLGSLVLVAARARARRQLDHRRC